MKEIKQNHLGCFSELKRIKALNTLQNWAKNLEGKEEIEKNKIKR